MEHDDPSFVFGSGFRVLVEGVGFRDEGVAFTGFGSEEWTKMIFVLQERVSKTIL